ncbi:hypothetical protein BDV93DRAFT_562009 [Ceratobasidium sp. AG-I]|nr:hypothetical protein BDV93DRAFT_562009 [Ceratobasidium sp. AG-I]
MILELNSQQDFLSDNNDPQLVARLLALSHLLLARASILDAESDIDRAIEYLTRAAQLSQEGHDTRIKVLRNLIIAYSTRFEKYGRAGDINSAIEYQRDIVACAGDKHESYGILISELAKFLVIRYGESEDLDDIQGAVDYGTQALSFIPETDVSRIDLLTSLGESHRFRYLRLDELEDICKAINYHNQAIQLTPEGHPELPSRLSNLGSSYWSRFEHRGELEDISKAIDCQTQAVRLTTEGHSDMPDILDDLGRSHLSRFERLYALEDINKAIDCHNQATRLTPKGHKDLPNRLSNLGISYQRRFERLYELEDISKAVECHNQAVQFTLEGHSELPGRLNNLGSSYQCQFERLCELEDITKAIDSQTQAIQLTPEGHAALPGRLNNLGRSYLCRFEHLGELEDINKAINCQVQAIHLTSEERLDMPKILDNLGASYLCRFERLDELEDLSKSIDCHNQAIQLTPEGHPELPARLCSLGSSHQSRFERLGELDDISKAIDYQTRAVRLTPVGHRHTHSQLANLGGSYMGRFERLGEQEDADSAIKAYNQALHFLLQSHPVTPTIQLILGVFYYNRFIQSLSFQDGLKALECLSAAALSSTGSPSVRLAASRNWARLLSISDHSDSLQAHCEAMELLPEVVWLGMTSRRRYELITEIGTVAVEAAASAISSKQYDLALEWLEEGRSIVWNQTLQLRTPFDSLAMVDSVLAQRLQQVAKQLEIANARISNATFIGVHPMSSEQATLHHHRLVDQYNQFISQARGLPDFEDFMCPKAAAELMQAARLGPIVVVNVQEHSCDALILSPQSDEITHVPLQDLSLDDVAQLHRLMIKALRAKGIRERTMARLDDLRGDHFKSILAALWHKLVKPILDILGYTDKLLVHQLPHITWCTTGALSFLPIHAAGNYGSGEDRIFDYAITSYTPTLSALLATTSQSPTKMSGVLAVSQESTPGLSNLPGTKDELVHIKKHLKGLLYEQLENSQATPDSVLDAMEKYECVHLACHASQNSEDSTQSCFHLHNGTLSLERIAQRSLKNKSLAFLSACQTATGDRQLPDEAIHLAAGMLVAGYPSVIATMWSINDCDAPLVADEVYGQLGEMEFSNQVSNSAKIAQSVLVNILNRDQLSAPPAPREPSHADADESPVIQTRSGGEHACIAAEMSIAVNNTTDDESLNESRGMRDDISVPPSSATKVSTRQVFDIQDSSEAMDTVMDSLGDATTSNKTSSPETDDKTIDVWDALERFCISPNSNDANLPAINTIIELNSQQNSRSDSNNPQLVIRLLALSQLLLARATILDSESDIDCAIEHLTRAAQLSQEEHDTRIRVLRNLIIAYGRRFEKYGRARDINSAIEYQRQIIACTGNTHEIYGILLAELSNFLAIRYSESGDLDDIQGAVECGTRALCFIPESDVNRTNLLTSLGESHRRRFGRLDELEDISKAIDCHNQAVQLTPKGHPELPDRLSNLGNSYQCQFERLRELEDINKAIVCQTQAVQLTPEGDSELPGLLSDLGRSHWSRFQHRGELEDISNAINRHNQAIQLIPDGDPNMPGQLNNLGSSHLSRFERLNELEDINKSIDCHNESVQRTPEGDQNMPGRLSNLGIAYQCRFERLYNLEDISKAIDCHNQAVQLTPEEHPGLPGRLDNLGSSYQCQFERLDELENISKAIDCQSRAVQLTPEGHPELPNILSNLGTSYHCRFEHLGEVEDINKAIDCKTQAVHLTPEGRLDTSDILGNLGDSHMCRFQHLGELEDLSKAIDCQVQAVHLTTEGHPRMPCQLGNLGCSYMLRFERLGEVEDISRAIENLTRAAQLAPEGHWNVPRHSTMLGSAYMSRFERLGELEDAESAIKAHNQALQLLPQSHPMTPNIQLNLGVFYFTRLIEFQNFQDCLKALECLNAAALSSNGSPSVRLAASRNLARLLSISDRSASLPAHYIAMQLLPEVVWLGMTSRRRYELISEIGAVAVEAAAAAISSKEYALALEWLEQGRSIVWNQTLQIRTPFNVLVTIDSDLAQKLRQVAKQLETGNKRISHTTPFGVNTMSSEQAILQHHRLAEQYDRLVSQARDLPNFHDFMLPKTARELAQATRLGHVVVVNVQEDSCGALILSPRSDKIAHVPLPDLSLAGVLQLHGLMIKALKSKGIRERTMSRLSDLRGDHFKDILTALWRKLVKPILDHLGCIDKLPVNQLPHITWCTTGALSFLPIHATGNYGSGEDRIFDYAITSYTPTLSTLLVTTPQSSIQISGVLAVSQESTPGLSNLPGTKDELVHIKKHLEGLPYGQLENSQATPQTVLDAMEKYECVHLACHASQNAEVPTQSCFHLHNGTLSLDDITQRSLKNKSLAFLSACQTATGDQKLPDEAIHLAAGMLVAGYPSVIATMWSISDYDAPSVADEVYGQLVRNGKLDCSQVARALHVAVGALRAQVGEDAFSRWVPYIHMGV